MSDALVKTASDLNGNPPEITVADFKAIDLEARKEISLCTPEEILDRIHQAQKIVNTQKIRVAAMSDTLLDWHKNATAAERAKIAEHDRKYKVQTLVETSIERKPTISLSPEEKMIKRLVAAGFTEEKAKEFIASQKVK